jgi:hypothetical protein
MGAAAPSPFFSVSIISLKVGTDSSGSRLYFTSLRLSVTSSMVIGPAVQADGPSWGQTWIRLRILFRLELRPRFSDSLWECAVVGDMLILAYFVVCGISRLARFNVTAVALSDSTTGKVKYFEGTPIPTSIFIVLLLGVAFSQQAIENDLWFGVLRLGPAMLHPLTLLYAASGTAMISTFRIPKP